jgi:hypothetical protein
MKSTKLYTQLLYSIAQLGGQDKKEKTYICMGPGMENSQRVIYTQNDFYKTNEKINKYAEQIAELIKTKGNNISLTFDFLIRTPERKKLAIFGIHDYEQDGIKMIYKCFETEILKKCKGNIENLKKIKLPINPVFLRVGLIGFEPEKPQILLHTSSEIINKRKDNESVITNYYQEINKISNLNGRIVKANEFFKALKEQGIKLTINDEDLTFENYILNTLSGNNPEGIIEIPRQKSNQKIIKLNNYISKTAQK